MVKVRMCCFSPTLPCARRRLGKVEFSFSMLLEYQMVGRLMYLSKLCSESLFKELPIPKKGCLYLIHVFNVNICESF